MEETKSEDNISFGFTGSKGGEISKADLVTQAWQRAVENRSKEMRKGYFNIKTDKMGNKQRTWIPDAREQYINSVIALDILLTADYSSNYKEARKNILEKADNSFKKWGWRLYTTKIVKVTERGYETEKHIKVFTGEIVMPEPNQETGKVSAYGIGSNGKTASFDWSNNYHQYMQSLVYVYDELLAEISNLLKQVKYFKRTRKFT